MWASADLPLAFAETQLGWYTRYNRNARIGHYCIEISQLAAAALTAVAAATRWAPELTAALAGLTLLLTGLRQVFGSKEKWATMTWATVRIEHAMNLYRLRRAEAAAAGETAAAAGRDLILQVDVIITDETRGWADRLRASAPPPDVT